MQKIKIIHLISSLKRGGRERQLSNIVVYSNNNQLSNKIVYFNDVENSYLDEYDLRRSAIKIQKRNFFSRLIELQNFLKDNQPDIVYTWGNFETIFIFLLKPFNNFILINGSIRHGIRSRKVSHYLRTFFLHLSRYIVANSYAGLKANKLKKGFVLYNGIDNKFLSPLENINK